MAVGDSAAAAGFALVPDTGADEARVRMGANEINRTRDYAAALKNAVHEVWPVANGGTGANNKQDALRNLGIFVQSGQPEQGVSNSGDIWIKV